ncbi:flagellar operon protein (TIGR03826 family) [Paenibacillus sp. DS2015]|uniref:TIGR03826 family flagellar region protein n=1 Tax=Paenibacillus sp. DS2015 TaxID=3373917 RepID=UPI003D190048
MNLGNCPRCGKLYATNLRDMCTNCFKEIETECQLCTDYLRHHRGATIHEVSEETEVTVNRITRFIREGRISIIDAPNLAVPCEVCGASIREGHMCDSCRARLTREFSEAGNEEQNKDYRSKSPGQGAYSALDKYNK